MKNLLFAGLAVACLPAVSFAQDSAKLVWGGGEVNQSTYSAVYVPYIIDVLEKNRLAGYTWGGPSQGTYENAEKVTETPTNLAVGQLDLLKDLNGQPIPGTTGETYHFTILADNIGPECLYMVTDQEGFETFGDVLGNAWDMTIATGTELSGSFGTLKRLQSIYPDLNDANIVVGGNGGATDIVNTVASDANVTHGFFVMRPDPQSATFKAIKDKGLHLIPIVDYGLEDNYQFLELKVANGGLFGIGGNAQYLTTACTSVALITGDPATAQASGADSRTIKRLQETIKRIGAIPEEDLQPRISSWADMWDNLSAVAADKAKDLMEASKKALETAAEKVNDTLDK